MGQAVRTSAFESRGGLGFRALVRVRLGGTLRKLRAAWDVCGAARRVAAALELRRMPSVGDLAILGIQDTTPIRRYIGE